MNSSPPQKKKTYSSDALGKYDFSLGNNPSPSCNKCIMTIIEWLSMKKTLLEEK